MDRNINTDMENLNKLYEINRMYNSPKVIRNYPSQGDFLNNQIYLEKLSPYNYIPTYVKVIKKYNYNSLSPHKKTKQRFYDTINPINNEFPKERIHNYSTDYYTHGKYKGNNKSMINNINRINFETPEQIPIKPKNKNIIYISPYNSKTNTRFPTVNNRNPNYCFQTINKEDNNKNFPMNLINQSVEDRYLTTYNDNNISYLTNNNYMNKTAPYFSYVNSPNNNNIFMNNNLNSEIKIKLDDLIYIERRFNDIIMAIKNIRNIMNINTFDDCIEFFSFYFNSSLNNKFAYFFAQQNHIIIHTAMNLILYMIIVIYHLSLNPSMFIKVLPIIKSIFAKLRVNLYLFVKKIQLYYGDAFCTKNEIYFNNFNSFLIRNGIYDLSETDIIDIISRNGVHIVNEISNILDYYNSINNNYFCDFQNIFLLLSKMTEDDLYNYFFNNFLNISDDFNNNNIIYYNDNDDNYDNIIIQNEEDEDEQYLNNVILYYKMNKEIPPFLKFKSQKKYTLVLDLGGTLINVKIDNQGRAVCRLRPGLIDFLIGIKPFYEIISYTKLSKEYSDLIIRIIEKNRPLFDYNLYRDHCVLVGNRFIKDISRIGRDMTKIIMIDDVPENLENHIENGILILPFDGESGSEDDRVLFELKKLLRLFYSAGFEDLRNAIKSFRNEIFDKITLGNYN